ncbi:hypothetical protein I6N95_05040 [Vagococcus sp. BWB3-3]|uniref:Uncharacterized protein n=1 Tax=Vagococcus allomyrinae TaxID=2794353 RepID=A0A940P945_9ENTE|nr:hypothetical protein [Vagococcus allomyrinae]MBP1040375.1 hypothetical protein [Vagococcus allomyrinae]
MKTHLIEGENHLVVALGDLILPESGIEKVKHILGVEFPGYDITVIHGKFQMERYPKYLEVIKQELAEGNISASEYKVRLNDYLAFLKKEEMKGVV